MIFKKKLFKHGSSLAVLIPSEFVKLLGSNEVLMEFAVDAHHGPRIIIEPAHEQDTLENDPLFAVFIEAIYKNAMENPHTLKDGSAIFNERVMQLIEGVEVDEDEKERSA